MRIFCLANNKGGVTNAAFLIGTEEKESACRVLLTCFGLHFNTSANEERSTKLQILSQAGQQNVGEPTYASQDCLLISAMRLALPVPFSL
jgi:hypothetical protein